MALMKRTIFFFVIRRRIRLPGPCVMLWGKLSGSFVALAPCRALEVTAFLSRVCWRKCISLNMCQHIRLPTYQTVFFSSATLQHCVHSVPFRTLLSYELIEPRGAQYQLTNGLFLFIFRRLIHVKLRIQECFL